MGHLNQANELQYTTLLATAEEEVLAFAGLELDGTAVETFKGKGQYCFKLMRKPVKEVTYVKVNGSEVEYIFDKRLGTIEINAPTKGTVEVAEVLGYEENKVPLILRQCIAMTVNYWAKYINSSMVGVTSRTNELGSETLEHNELPLAVEKALTQFKHGVL